MVHPHRTGSRSRSRKRCVCASAIHAPWACFSDTARRIRAQPRQPEGALALTHPAGPVRAAGSRRRRGREQSQDGAPAGKKCGARGGCRLSSSSKYYKVLLLLEYCTVHVERCSVDVRGKARRSKFTAFDRTIRYRRRQGQRGHLGKSTIITTITTTPASSSR